MAMKDLTPFEDRLYRHILEHDYEANPWITTKVARELGVPEQDVYNALSELTKKIRDNVWVFYRSGHLHVVAE